MAITDYPSDREIRAALLRRVRAFCRASKMGASMLGRRALNDPNFVGQIEAGRNFSIDTYARINKFIDKNTPKGNGKAPKNGK